jgi:hypothetical protein
MPRATKDGAKVPSSNKRPLTVANAGTVEAAPWEIATAVMKHVQVTAKVREKNLRRDPTSLSSSLEDTSEVLRVFRPKCR